ncbi:glycoside hydrolase family 3 protein [Echinimonas agarilytica]|uniref:Glycoside hydrolase family 3 C-terminal domain-containing protein n=1 Tax=Echinimonas agarilytica TaxID=1215918 RepID=A0AA41W529_9GAMM|nr:glycoside hydrolase family 3 N-terminal domain-containing protein [Echinimonas agarilytica]MCM2679035.1 glycoside hydrolase family 3 C-terminal domain-containing protein [Echinimonas agarilytica]
MSQPHNIEIWPEMSSPVDDAVESRILEIMSTMTLEQKIAQMIQPEIRYVSTEQMKHYGFGSYLNGGGSFPYNEKLATPQRWIDLAESYFVASKESESGIATMWGTDAVHGHNNVIGATLFPHNIGLGAAGNSELVRKIGEATAREVLATGIEWAFAPTVAVVRDNRWGRTYEGYSESPEIVHEYASAMVEGLQGKLGENFFGDEQLIATAKHFVGDGGTDTGIDQGDNLSSEQVLFDIHAQGYVSAIESGVQTIMASFNSWHGEKLHGHKYLLTDVLKDRMGFDGLIVGDWNGHGQVKGCRNDSCAAVIEAGVDIIMVPEDWEPLYHNTLAQAQSGEVTMERVNDAVARILRVKIRTGVLDSLPPSQRPLSGKEELIGHPSHRDIARQAVRESLVLLKDNGGLLPINPQQHVLLAGSGADNIGQQSGGWSITWQGTGNKNSDFPGATSIYQGFKESIESAGGSIELGVDGSYQQRPDVAVVVFGETPYAEGVGDIEHLEFQARTKEDLALLNSLKAQGIPVVSVFLTGRPLWTNKEINASDAFVVAWLPGSEGQGVADVLVAAKNGLPKYDFVGKLSFSWPMFDDQLILNREDAEYVPLFGYGYGLTYLSMDKQVPVLTEKNNMDYPKPSGDLVIFDRVPASTMQMVLWDENDRNLVTSKTQAFKESLTFHTVDWHIQEDAIRLVWSGEKKAYFSFAEHPRNLTTFMLNDAELVFEACLGDIPNGDVLMKIISQDDGESAVLTVNEHLQGAEPHNWQTVRIPLKDFDKEGYQWVQVMHNFVIESEAALDISLAHIRIVPKIA